MIQGTLGVIQGTFGVSQGTFGVIQGTFGVIQGTFGHLVQLAGARAGRVLEHVRLVHDEVRPLEPAQELAVCLAGPMEKPIEGQGLRICSTCEE